MILLGYIHNKGTSKKTGKDYDFYELHAATCSPRCEGYQTTTVNVSPEEFQTSGLTIGSLFVVERDGFITGIRVTGQEPAPFFKVR